MLIAGVDEAGRGPVIGPLVVAGVAIEEKNIKKLEELGVKDSKLLTPKRREELFSKIKELTEYKILIIPPQEVDDAVNSASMNLNWLEAVKYAMVINALNPDKAYVDCPSVNNKAFKEYMEQFLKKKPELIVENKADLNYPIVGAASILAKVTRDREIKKLREKYGDFNSGYPSDPKTKEFLKKYHKKYPEIFRHSWSSYQKLQDNQTKLI
ncbi:MAG: ribonuclease HII [archaeon]